MIQNAEETFNYCICKTIKKKNTNERPKSIQPNNYRHIISYSRCNSFFQFYIQDHHSL